jgi:hypothetical protein
MIDTTTIPRTLSFPVSPDWRICRWDSLNWCLMHWIPPHADKRAKDKESGMTQGAWSVEGNYSDLEAALRGFVKRFPNHAVPTTAQPLVTLLQSARDAITAMSAELRAWQTSLEARATTKSP